MKMSRPILLIMLGVVSWGVVHGVGSYYGGIDRSGDNFLQHDLRRFFIVFGCVVGFLAFWGLMLLSRKRRLEREANDAE